MGLLERLAISLYGVAFYLGKTVVPLDLSPFYPLRRPIQPLTGLYLLSGGVVVVVTAFVILVRRRWPALGAVWLVYVVTLLPVSGSSRMDRRSVPIATVIYHRYRCLC